MIWEQQESVDQICDDQKVKVASVEIGSICFVRRAEPHNFEPAQLNEGAALVGEAPAVSSVVLVVFVLWRLATAIRSVNIISRPRCVRSRQIGAAPLVVQAPRRVIKGQAEGLLSNDEAPRSADAVDLDEITSRFGQVTKVELKHILTVERHALELTVSHAARRYALKRTHGRATAKAAFGAVKGDIASTAGNSVPVFYPPY
eukprot:22429-Pleurochrysis_carterae.AAC.1